MGLSKHQEHDMNDLEIFLSKINLKLEKSIRHSSPREWSKVHLFAKYMLMILFLAQQTVHIVKSLAILWSRNLRYLCWES
jgi:nitrate reductase gamma subunit